MNSPERIADEYRSLDDLSTRILTHRRYTEGSDDPDLDVLRTLRLAPDAALLDVGSGTGEFLRRLRAEGHVGKLRAVDASPAAVQAAGAVQDVAAELGDATALPYQDAEFDAVTARHMLYHVPDPVRAIAEARRVLRPGGRFAAVVNVAEQLPLINATVDAVLGAHGIARKGFDGSVDGASLPGMVESVFGSCDTLTTAAALVFDDPEPVLRYCLTLLTLSGAPQDGPLRGEIERELAEAVRGRFAELGGPWRDPKGYVVCSAVRDAPTGDAVDSGHGVARQR